MDFLRLSDIETLDIMSVLEQNILSRPSVNTPHKIMVWFPDVANRMLKSNTPAKGYCVTVRPVSICSEKCRQFVETLWDRGYVTIEIVRNNGAAYYFSLPRDAVISRNIDNFLIERVGENPFE
jgi:hypothetical protein